MPADNKSVVRRFYEEVWNKRNLSLIDGIISPSHALHDPNISGSQVGPQMYRRQVEELIKAFPDLRFSIEETAVDNDKTVVTWTISGTHKGEFMGVPATGWRVSVEGVTTHRFGGGKIVDSFVEWDALGLMRQLEVLPAPTRTHKVASRG